MREGRYAWAALAAFAFAEASFFPIPPDVMLVPMMLANRKRAFVLAAWCTFWSVLGGMLGYAIGALFWDTAGMWLIDVLHMPLATVEALRAKYARSRLSDRGAGPDADPLQARDHLRRVSRTCRSRSFMLFSTITRSVRFIVLEGDAASISSASRRRPSSRSIWSSSLSSSWRWSLRGVCRGAAYLF